MGYKVKLASFEGPFDLLVYLIEHNKMNIYDIKVSEITAQYLEYIEEAKAHDVNVAQEFMVLAAELIELKSAMLLPREIVDEETGELEDPRKQLVARILEYKQFKEMASFLADQAELTSHMRSKPQEDLTSYTGETEEILKGDMDSFASAFLAFLTRKQRLEEMHKTYERIARVKMTLENKVNQIIGFFKNKKQVKFSEMIEGDDSPFNRVITFMSILELLRQHSIRAEQKKRFGDIDLERIEPGEYVEPEPIDDTELVEA
ncbi:MAG: segregation/condensation protein A [Clostridia bacterium]|nr:segregation/condensation protein A [Clostridia bacterium]